jgi:hypothetical protein
MYYFLAGFMNKDNLGFTAQGIYACMAQTIFCFKIVFVHKIIMRDMTVIAMGYFTVRTMVPGGILRSHDVAVYTGLGPV